MAEAQEIVEVLVPIIEGAIARRMTEVYEVIEEMRGQVQETVTVMDGNDQAIVAALQELRGVVTGDGYMVEEVIKRAGESWERFVKGEAEALGFKMLTPKVILTPQMASVSSEMVHDETEEVGE